MKRVAGRMMHREMSEGMIRMRENWTVAKNAARAERMMKRVAGRMLHKEMSDMMISMRENWVIAKNAARAERIMKRSLGRMRFKEMSDALIGWVANWREARNAERAERMMKRVAGFFILSARSEFLAVKPFPSVLIVRSGGRANAAQGAVACDTSYEGELG